MFIIYFLTKLLQFVDLLFLLMDGLLEILKIIMDFVNLKNMMIV